MALTSTEKSRAFRARIKDMGLKRLEVYAHPDDREEIRELVSTLCDKRGLPTPPLSGVSLGPTKASGT